MSSSSQLQARLHARNKVAMVTAHLVSSSLAASAPPRQLPGPLTGTRVLDVSLVISGPWACSVLADQGADVIKIEGPKSPDLTRTLGPSPLPREAGLAAMYVTANRGKRSVVLDLGNAAGVAALKRMAANADVLVQNFRPGVAERLGVGYEDMRAVNDQLIYLSISGFGPDGPYSKAKVYDQVVQAMSGVGAIMKDSEGRPGMFHNLLVDKVTALHAAQSVTAALFARERGAGGQHIQLSMLEAACHFLMPDAGYNDVWPSDANEAAGGPALAKAIDWHFISKSSEWACKDGKVAITVTDPKMLEGLLKTVGRSAEEFMKPGQQMPRDWGQVYGRSRKALIDAVGEMDRDAVFKGCMEHGTPCGKFLSREEVMEDAQVKHNETFQTIVHPEAGKFRTPLPPARFSNTPSQLRAPPLFGQNTDEVLAEFGFDAEEVAALRRGGVTK